MKKILQIALIASSMLLTQSGANAMQDIEDKIEALEERLEQVGAQSREGRGIQEQLASLRIQAAAAPKGKKSAQKAPVKKAPVKKVPVNKAPVGKKKTVSEEETSEEETSEEEASAVYNEPALADLVKQIRNLRADVGNSAGEAYEKGDLSKKAYNYITKGVVDPLPGA